MVVSGRIVDVADADGEVFVPALCLAEAYRRADGVEHDYLAVLSSHPHVTVIPLAESDCWVVGGFAKKLGSLHLAQATAETGARPLIPLLTAHRDTVTHHLPKEWPIIDLK
jgi:hypothetical protein